MKIKLTVTIVLLALSLIISCQNTREVMTSDPETYEDETGGGGRFKVPLPPGYDWEVTQSWAEHCEECDLRYKNDQTKYCESSHMSKACDYGWDFNLPGNADLGKPALASADGLVKTVAWNSGWGNYVILDHGSNLCTRYAHLMDDSILVEEGQSVCQGLVLASIAGTGGFPPHLHFQFEKCDSPEEGIPRGFDDGNGIPICTKGSDVFEKDGETYNFLILTNEPRDSCPQNGGGICNDLGDCPINPSCSRAAHHEFDDIDSGDYLAQRTAAYLFQECAVDGYEGNKYRPYDKILRAEALKMAMYLFGLMDDDCDGDVEFRDVDRGDWFYDVINCALDEHVISGDHDEFRPNEEIIFGEAVAIAARAAEAGGFIEIREQSDDPFPNIPDGHWANPYAETVERYDGLMRDASYYHVDSPVWRHDFSYMLSMFSPCFCGNKDVECDDGCVCKQEFFACTDPHYTGDTGGGSDDDDWSDDDWYDDDYSDDDADDDDLSDDDLDDDDQVDDDDDTSDDDIMDDDSSDDDVSDDDSGDDDEWTWDWECDPGDEFLVSIFVPGGDAEYLTVYGGYQVLHNLPQEPIYLSFACEEFPLSILLHGDYYLSEIRFNTAMTSPMAIWHPYNGDITRHPSGDPDEITDYFITWEEYTNTLVIVPPM